MEPSANPQPNVVDENLDEVFDRMAERYVKSVSTDSDADEDWEFEMLEHGTGDWDPLYDIPLDR